MEQKWVVKDNGKFHVIGSSREPTQYPERYLAPAEAGRGDGDLIVIVDQKIEDSDQIIRVAVIDPEKKLERETLVDSRNNRLKENADKRRAAVAVANERLDKLDIDKIKTVSALKVVVGDLVQLIKELK